MIDYYKTEIEKGLFKRYNGKDSDIGILESVTSFSDIIFMGGGNPYSEFYWWSHYPVCKGA